MKAKNKQALRDAIFLSVTAVATALCVTITVFIYDYVRELGKNKQTVAESSTSAISDTAEITVDDLAEVTMPDYVEVSLLKVGKARSGEKLQGVKSIVIHYVGNAGTTARQNRNYFGLAETAVCSHFIVGLDGEVIQCVPINEQSAASNERNVDTISIEVCHPEEDGKFNPETYDSVIKLTAWLCELTGLTEADVIRHHDITGKDCPKYFVDNPDEWDNFKADVKAAME